METKPSVEDYDSQDEWMAACVPIREEEGDEHDQAVAVCLDMWRNKGSGGPEEHKAFESVAEVVDEDEGIVEAYVAVFGVVDDGDDRIRNGAFSKTLVERGNRVRCLDAHNNWSVRDVIGKPLEIREVGREELPDELLRKYPDATGALYTKTQYLLDTPEGKGAFTRIKEKAIDEYSIGYDPIAGSTDTTKEDDRVIRNLREIRLWEYGPVLWGMNPATTTVGVKAVDDDSIESPLEKRGEDLLEERKKALVKEFRGLLDELQKHSINAPAKDAGRDEDTTPDGGAEPQKALTPEQDEERTELLQKIREQLEE